MTPASTRVTVLQSNWRPANLPEGCMSHVPGLWNSARRGGNVAYGLMTASLFVMFLPIAAISYLAMWIDTYTDHAADDQRAVRPPRQPR